MGFLSPFTHFEAFFRVWGLMGCYEGREWVSLCGVGHVELSEGFFGLTDFPLMCEGRSSTYGQWTSWDLLSRGGASGFCINLVPING